MITLPMDTRHIGFRYVYNSKSAILDTTQIVHTNHFVESENCSATVRGGGEQAFTLSPLFKAIAKGQIPRPKNQMIKKIAELLIHKQLRRKYT